MATHLALLGNNLIHAKVPATEAGPPLEYDTKPLLPLLWSLRYLLKAHRIARKQPCLASYRSINNQPTVCVYHRNCTHSSPHRKAIAS